MPRCTRESRAPSRILARAWEIGSRLRRFTILKDAAYATVNVLAASPRETGAVYRRAA